jgi:hypothetical protein
LAAFFRAGTALSSREDLSLLASIIATFAEEDTSRREFAGRMMGPASRASLSTRWNASGDLLGT